MESTVIISKGTSNLADVVSVDSSYRSIVLRDDSTIRDVHLEDEIKKS